MHNYLLSRSCAICLENYVAKDLVKEFNCKLHIYHTKCLKVWLENSNYCPLCKHDLLNDYYVEEDEVNN